MEMTFEDGASVLAVLFGVGLGGVEALKRFVQQVDDPLLFGKRFGSVKRKDAKRRNIDIFLCSALSQCEDVIV